jgi:hypothetical protein
MGGGRDEIIKQFLPKNETCSFSGKMRSFGFHECYKKDKKKRNYASIKFYVSIRYMEIFSSEKYFDDFWCIPFLLFVFFSESVDDEVLRELFAGFGEIKSHKVMKHRRTHE